ncbi:Hypothetical predicted protein, partial [Paramuricea clavata]
EDVTQQHQELSSSESEMDTTPLGLMLVEPCPPKEDPDKGTRKEFESLPALQLFKHHLKDFEGGSRKHEVAKDHTRQVCRLLYELEDSPTNVKPLWDSNNLNVLKNNFFKGNDLLGEEDKRHPATLKVYIILLRLETWPKALTDAMNKIKADIRLQDV